MYLYTVKNKKMNVYLVFLLIVFVSGIEISMIRSKIFTCTEFEVLTRDSVDNILSNIHSCIKDTHFVDISLEYVSSRLKIPVQNYKEKLDDYRDIHHKASFYNGESRRLLRNIQRNIVGIQLNLKYLISESELPALVHLSDETEMRKIKEYLKENAKYVNYIKSIPFKTFIVELQNVTRYTKKVADAVVERDETNREMRLAIDSFRTEFISKYKKPAA